MYLNKRQMNANSGTAADERHLLNLDEDMRAWRCCALLHSAMAQFELNEVPFIDNAPSV
jgi:hypothetical protein